VTAEPANTLRAGRRDAVAWTAALLLFAVTGFEQARANGVPTLVELAYLEDLSNWGPEDATGEIELSFAEGFAILKADGLEQLTGGSYQGWLVNSESNDAISIGRFNADADGHVEFEGTLPAIADFGFDLFIVSVEPEPDDAPQPSANRSIGGHFSLVGPQSSDGSAPGDVSMLPSQLPNTGDATLVTDIVRVSLLVAAMAVSVLVGVRIARRPA
jgi:hypothetical protein